MREGAIAEHLRREAMVGRHVLGMAFFLIMLLAGLLLVNYFEPCGRGRGGLAAPCYDPLEDRPHC